VRSARSLQPSGERKAKSPARARQTKAKGRPKHAFTVSHHRDEDFDSGLRRYAHYRDLGMARATQGMVQACFVATAPRNDG
jgi:hypothetical protein